MAGERFARSYPDFDEAELDAADWFPYDGLPTLPSPASIARRMIESWVRARSRDATPFGEARCNGVDRTPLAAANLAPVGKTRP